ncbi:MAG: glycerol-3-phosphate 1-O-acyltransferase PlsY [Deltaproteobacteria bacterium]
MHWILAGALLSYLIGSIPTAYLFGRFLKGIDIRKHGSGNIGATNALRVLGTVPGILVLLIDILKGFLPVLLIGGFVIGRSGMPAEIALIPLALAAISGHIWTVFLNFNGGKGIATALGVLLGLAFRIPGLNVILALLVLIWALVFTLSRMVSLASIIGAASLPVLIAVFGQSRTLFLAGLVLALFTIYRHKENLKRIISGKEKKIFSKSS